MTDEQKTLLREAVQLIGAALTENMQFELDVVDAVEKALVNDNYDELRFLVNGEGDV